jgi:DNA-directed RNA polymerase II subunit RPB1
MDMEKVLREDLDIQGIDNIQKIYQKKISMPYWFEKHRSDTERNLQSWREPASDQIYKEYYFESTGTNLKKLLAMEIIDTKRTISNDIYEIYNTLGVEAARAALISETKWVFAHYGIYVNYRHIALLIDWMTRRGNYLGGGEKIFLSFPFLCIFIVFNICDVNK